MTTDARQIGECLPAETIARIREIEEKVAGDSGEEFAIAPAVANDRREEGTDRPFPAPIMQDGGKVIRLVIPKYSRKPHGSPAVLLCFDMAKRVKRHAAALTSRRLPH